MRFKIAARFDIVDIDSDFENKSDGACWDCMTRLLSVL